MKENRKNSISKMTLSSVFIALATGLSMIKVINMPLGGSVTLMSMVPIVFISCALGVKWGIGSAFVYALIQLVLGISVDGLFAWGLTPACLIGTILLDYIVPFTLLGISGIFAKKGVLYITLGTAFAVILRFLCHFASGYIIFANFEKFVVLGSSFVGRPALYSICYNGLYMLPELIITVAVTAVIFKFSSISKFIR